MDEMMSGAVELMGLGMGVVFVFLIALVGATSVMSRVMSSLAPDPPEGPKTGVGPKTRSIAAPEHLDPKVKRAIQLAIDEHRRRHRQ